MQDIVCPVLPDNGLTGTLLKPWHLRADPGYPELPVAHRNPTQTLELILATLSCQGLTGTLLKPQSSPWYFQWETLSCGEQCRLTVLDSNSTLRKKKLKALTKIYFNPSAS